MIPEQFKQNVNLDIQVFGHDVQVNYNYYWLDKPRQDGKEPLISHMEFTSDVPVISDTGYRSHFFHTELLHHTTFQTIAELVTHIGEKLSKDSGYEPPAPQYQLSLF